METAAITINHILETAKERSKKFHVLKFKKLIGSLLNPSTNFFINSSNIEFIKALNLIKANDLIEFGSDFFWSQIHRLSAELEKETQNNSQQIFIYLLISAFDSFYQILPNESMICFNSNKDIELLFPKLALQFKSFKGEEISISKADDNFVTIENYGLSKSKVAFNTIAPQSHFQLKKDIVCDKISFLYQKSENLYEEHYLLDISENLILSINLKRKIELAFKVIKENDGELFRSLVDGLDYIIPNGNASNNKYPNFAIATLKKAIFLSIELLKDPIFLIAECIIHEHGHCELHIIQDTVLLTTIENEILEYYSPWRKDPRPLLGLLHGIFISHKIICFYFKYITNNKSDNILDVHKKITLIIHQIILACKQIRQNELTKFTQDLLQDILVSTYQISELLNISISEIPQEITSHISDWKIANATKTVII